MAIIISQKIRQKLEDENHQVPEQDIAQCFANRGRGFVLDDREPSYGTSDNVVCLRN